MKSILTNGLKQIYSTQITQPLSSVAWNGLPSKLFFKSFQDYKFSEGCWRGRGQAQKQKDRIYKRELGVLMEKGRRIEA